VVVAAGPHRTLTDDNGNYHLVELVGGTYTLAVAKAGYTFSPPRRTISLLNDLSGQNFEAYAGGGPDAFLDLPLFYDGSAATLMALLRDTDEGGWIDAWFDHDAPNYTKNQDMVLWDGVRRTQELYNPSLGCYERRCYEGHDGIDFPYRDPDPSTPNIFEPILVRPAAAGVVAAVVQNCEEGDRWCNGGYGNEVLLWHDNGYFTRYSHLASVSVSVGQQMTPDLSLGVMGNSGNAMGTHLHFAVHHDNDNKRWDGEKVDLPVDPFGWSGVEADPWVTRGVVSRWLWRFNPSSEAILLGSEGATLRDGVGNVTVRIPAGALAGQVRVELVTGAAVAPPAVSLHSLGRGFRLQVLDWLQGGDALNAAPARPIEMSVGFTGAATRHLDLSKALLYHWQTNGWSPLPTVVEQDTRAVIAAGAQFGDFDLQAPLLCPADSLEPDDSFDAAAIATASTTSWDRLFDVAEDEDWIEVEAAAGKSYQVSVEATASGVAFTVELYDRDGLTRLAHRTGPGALTLTPVQAGNYFVRVAPQAGSTTGCDAGYRLHISLPSN
jgi:murein DD-endopeptidase MepM/ murein hydrolase activator NlpD